MNYKNIVGIIFLFTSLNIQSQNNSLAVTEIPEDLKKNANAVVRSNHVEVDISSTNKMIVKKKRIVTVLNKKGNTNIDAFAHYDNNSKIRDIKVIVYDRFGNEIKKIRKNDFKDVSAVSNGTLYSDSRVKYLDYTPISYPYTIEFISETVNGTSGYLPRFMPINDYFLSVENSSYTLNYSPESNIRKQEENIKGIDLAIEEFLGKIHYQVNSLNAIKPEAHSVPFIEFIPKVLFASSEFYYEGVPAKAKNWNELGKWIYQSLLKDTNDLSPSTINHVRNLVKNDSDDIEKAKKIYQYVQDRTRYISVQVGIGGWKPFNASEVDRLGYGDCKGLTNYTMALLKAVGVESNYALVYSGNAQQSFDEDFALMQGDHVILNIPLENGEDVWLECTSQKNPFGLIGAFTDNRNVLVVTPEGGEIKRTKKYETIENSQVINGECEVSPSGTVKVLATIVSQGINYDRKFGLESQSKKDLERHYKDDWDYINNISIDKIELSNDRENISFKENINFIAENFAIISGDRMLVNINILNKQTYVPDRNRNRKLPLKIFRGFIETDEVEISLPEGYILESLPDKESIETKFGSYKRSIELLNDKKLIFKREFILKDGEHPKEDYSEFRNFFRNIARKDNLKISLIKSKP